VERPLQTLLPEVDEDARQMLACTLFSAVRGVVALGLEERWCLCRYRILRTQLPRLRGYGWPRRASPDRTRPAGLAIVSDPQRKGKQWLESGLPYAAPHSSFL
jgi:hypothetical protein